MADLALPLIVVGPIGVALSAAVGGMWKRLADERKGCDDRISAIEERFDARIDKLERDGREGWDRWAREVERGVKLRSLPADEPRRPEPPEWDEPTGVRHQRDLIERRALDEELRRYSESTPPRPRLPSRPR